MKLLKIYGERNTSTNYLGELVKLNLDVEQIPGVVPPRMRRIQTRLPAKNALRDIYFSLTFHRNLGWKHSRVTPEEDLRRYSILKKNDVFFLTITKNPYSWLLSLYRRPYHQSYTVKPDFETFLEMPWTKVRRDNVREEIRNPMELWNIKNRSYLALPSSSTLNLTTEELFRDAESVITSIAEKFNIEQSGQAFVNFEESTKYEEKNSDYYKDYYNNERWKDKISPQAIEIANRHLDKQLMRDFGYSLL